jgi:hypothetical protein
MRVGDDDIHLSVFASEGEDEERPGVGFDLGAQIYPFKASAGNLLVEWAVPDPLPAGPAPTSRICACDNALVMFRAARAYVAAGRPFP